MGWLQKSTGRLNHELCHKPTEWFTQGKVKKERVASSTERARNSLFLIHGRSERSTVDGEASHMDEATVKCWQKFLFHNGKFH